MTEKQSDIIASLQSQVEALQAQLTQHDQLLEAQKHQGAETKLAELKQETESLKAQLAEREKQAFFVEQLVPTSRLDETVKGGRYRVDQTESNPLGRLVDANGVEIKE